MNFTLIRLFLFFSIILMPSMVCSQGMSLEWVKKVAPQFYNAGAWEKSVVTDANGDSYTLGHFFLTVDFDPGPGIHLESTTWGQGAFYLRKLDGSGAFQWVRVFECDDAFHGGRGLQIDSSGNVVLMLNFTDSVDMLPGPGLAVHYDSSPDRGVVVAKFDNAGNYLWSKSISGTNEVWATELVIDNANQIYMTGYFKGTVDFDPGPGTFSVASLASPGYSCGFLVKLDAIGGFDWVTTVISNGTNDSKFIDVGVGRFGDVYAMASLEGNGEFIAPFDTLPLATSGPTNTYFFKLDTAGHLIWDRTLVGSNAGTGHSLCIDSASNIYAVGYLADTLDIDPGLGVYNLINPGTSSNYALKWDSAGTFVWGDMISCGSYCKAYDTDCDRNGNLYIATFHTGSCQVFGGAGVSYTSTASNIFYTKLDPQGNYLWSQPMSSPWITYGYDIHADLYGNLYTTAQLSDTTTVGDGPFAQHTGVADGISCFAKWGPCPVMYGNDTVIACNEYTSPAGASYTSSGTYTDTFSYWGGCDSIITTELTIIHVDTGFVTVSACDEYQSPAGALYTSSGIYYDTAASVLGCDSIIVTDLTIHTVDTGIVFSMGTLSSMQMGGSYQWLYCDSSYAEVFGETGPTFTPIIPGNYALRVEMNGCVDTSFCYNVGLINTPEIYRDDAMVLFPNPSDGVVTVEFGSLKSLVEIEVVDVTGKLLLSTSYSEVKQCNLEFNFAPGLYYLVVQLPNARRVFTMTLN